MSEKPSQRTYQFAPLDRPGWILGLSGGQCLASAAGVVAAGALLRAGVHPAVALVPLVLATVFAFGSWDGRSCRDELPHVVLHTARRVVGADRWIASVPLARGGRPVDAPLPSFLAGLEIVDAGSHLWAAEATDVGFLWDHRERTVSASLRVRGGGFSLEESVEQERLVQAWGDVLGGFCTEHRTVSSIRTTEWAMSAGRGHRPEGQAVALDPDHVEAHASYVEVLHDAGAVEIVHECLVTVTVDLRRVRTSRHVRREEAARSALFEELRGLSLRLDGAGLEYSPPLSADELTEVMRRRIDPEGSAASGDRPQSLAVAAGLASWGPLAVRSQWSSVRVDGSLHRTYWIAEWPRFPVPPNWIEGLLLHAAGTRCVSFHYEPVPPSGARRRIDRDSIRLASDEDQRNRTGFRTGAHHRRAQAAVQEREAELVAGSSDLEFIGFVTVSARDEAALESRCCEYEQAAAQAGLVLRPLDARHDVALVCTLPAGRGVGSRGLQ
jgi:hypothetical protein